MLEKGNKKLLNAWAFYDWANSVYTLTIASSIFPIFYSALFLSDEERVFAFGFEMKQTVLISIVTAFTFLVVVFFSLMGMEMSAVHAEEVKNPQRDYPRALYYSSLIIVITSILASTAIAIVVPKNSLNIVSGLDQAFTFFFNAFHLKWLLPFVILIIILGGFGGMAAWVIGPPKGLAVAAQDGCAPHNMTCNKEIPDLQDPVG